MAGAGDSETVTVIRPVGRTQLGDETGTLPEFDIDGCLFAPGPSREAGLSSEQVRTDGTIYAPAGADVRATDRVRIRGQVYSVVGQPQDWGGRFGLVIPVRSIVG
jgi:hypothetical protein